MLGAGSFGSVTADGDKAIKQFKTMEHLIAEVFVTKYCSSNSPYVIELKGCSFKNLTMTSKRWHCSLDKALENNTISLTQKRSMHCCILKALVHIEALHIVHADIKPANILVDRTFTKAVIADFGIASSSNRARVKQTSPAYSIRHDKAKSHRTHDLFSFVMLTLNLFYRYRTYRELTSREELRSVVRSVCTDKVLCNVLLKLVQNDELDCWTAEQALTELYKEQVSIPRPHFVLWTGASDKTSVVVSTYITKLAEMFFPNKVERLKDCAMLLTGSLPKDCPKLTTYLCTLAYVFVCIFGCTKVMKREDRMSIKDIMNLTGSTNADVIGCLNTILSYQDLVSLIYAP